MLGTRCDAAAVCPAPSVSLSIGHMLWIFLPAVTRGLSPFFALLMFGGLWGWRNVWLRRDNQPLFYTSLAVLAGAWVQLWYDQAMCPRYVLPIVLMGAMFAALSLLDLMARMAVWIRQRGHSTRIRALVAALPLVVVAVHGFGESMIANRNFFASRQVVADLGARLGREVRPIHMIIATGRRSADRQVLLRRGSLRMVSDGQRRRIDHHFVCPGHSPGRPPRSADEVYGCNAVRTDRTDEGIRATNRSIRPSSLTGLGSLRVLLREPAKIRRAPHRPSRDEALVKVCTCHCTS